MSPPADDSFDLIDASVAIIHEAMADGRVTAEGLVDRYLVRIEAFDDDLNSILEVNDDARQRARRLDGQLESEGFVGLLHGIPVVLKDNQDTHDMPTTAGSVALAESRPPRDAFIVKQLRDSGAVILAKSNMQELSLGLDTVSSLGGATRNAYDIDRRPSGSSGGSATSVAANMTTLATGTDTCSSVRSPPAFNNLVGVRPTRGLVSRTGIIPLSGTLDTPGPIARTVSDAARMLEVMAGYDPEDPITARGVGTIPQGGYVAQLNADGLAGATIGVVRQYFGLRSEESGSPDDAEAVTAVVDRAIDTMSAAGATIVDHVDVVDDDQLRSARLVQYEFARDFDEYLAEVGSAVPYDSLAEVVDSGELESSVESRIKEGNYLNVEHLDRNAEYLRRLQRRHHLADATISRLVEDDLDAVLYPPSTIPPVTIPDRQPFEEMNCRLSSHTGLPAIVLPAGFTDDGLPVGLELLGRPFTEDRLFELAYAFEQVTDHRRPPSRFRELN